MVSQEEINDSPDSPKDDIHQPKKIPKAIRILTVMAYVLSVSMAAILLSIYYIFMWEGRPHIGALSGEQMHYPEFLMQNRSEFESIMNASVVPESRTFYHDMPLLGHHEMQSNLSYIAEDYTDKLNETRNSEANQTDGRTISNTNSSTQTLEHHPYIDNHDGNDGRKHDMV